MKPDGGGEMREKGQMEETGGQARWRTEITRSDGGREVKEKGQMED